MRFVIKLFCLTWISLMAGCGGPAQDAPQTLPTAANEPTPTVSPTTTPEPTPTPLPPEPTLVPTPDTLPSAEIPAADLPPGDGMQTPPEVQHPVVSCTLQGDVYQCYDELLEMSFRYPDFIGPLAEAQLRPGGYAGYSYEYYFEAAGSGAGMGGRSRDFSEGRGRMYTDQPGFGGRSQDEICAVWRAEICRELRPGVLLLGMFPRGQWYCSDAMIHTSSPRVLLAIDLSQHAQIHGFGFTWSLMTPEQEAALQSDWYSGGRLCDPENQATFDAWMAEIRQGVKAGAADAEMQRRYDAMLHLAESIQTPYLGAP